MHNLLNLGRATTLVFVIAATNVYAADAVKAPQIAGTTWKITPTGNGNLEPKTVVYSKAAGTSGTATIFNTGSAQPTAPNATWKLDLAKNYVMMFANGTTRAYRSAWAMNGQPQNPMLGFSCTLKAPSTAPTFACADNGSNYSQAPQ